MTTLSSLQDYHADHSLASKSKLDVLRRSPFEYAVKFLYPHLAPPHVRQEWAKQQDARHFVIGQALDDVVTQGQALADKYFRGTTKPRNTTDGKTAHAEAIADNPGKVWLHPDEWGCVTGMAAAIKASPFAPLVDTSRSQATITWTDPSTGLGCKCRPDWLKSFQSAELSWWLRTEVGIDADEVVFDLKSIDGLDAFPKHAVDFRYHVQNAMYLDGVEAHYSDHLRRVFAFMVVDVNWPHAVMVRTLPAEAVRIGRAEYQQDLEILRSCREIALPQYPTLAQVAEAWPMQGGDWAEAAMPSWWMWKNRNI